MTEQFQQPQKKNPLMYTPVHHIPIGEPLKTTDGQRAVKFKKPGSKETEVILLHDYIAMLIHATDKC